MDRTTLPAGLRAALTAATRAQGAALASVATTGPQAVAAVAGVSLGLVSRWGSEAHPECPSIEAATALELASGTPLYAAVLAAATGHKVVPIVDEEAPRVTPERMLHAFAGAAHRFVSDFHEALEDEVLTPAEARALLDHLGRLAPVLAEIRSDLARRVEGAS